MAPISAKGANKRVMEVLTASPRPMTAYEILGALASEGINGPPTVYRALDKLIAEGHVHRIKSLNAFISCHVEEEHHASAFAVCSKCKAVEEIHDERLENLITNISDSHGFHLHQQMIELVGLCKHCEHVHA